MIAIPGGFKTIEELHELYGLDQEFIVYAFDHASGKIVPALAKQPRPTAFLPAFKVTFDNGKTITGDATHRLMLRDGTYKRIGELQPGDAMMPFERKSLTGGYPYVYTVGRNEDGSNWTPEHLMLAEFASDRSAFVSKNNPAERKDITFERILEWCDLNGFSAKGLMAHFKCSRRAITFKLRKKGFRNFEQFAAAYGRNARSRDVAGQNNPRYLRGVTYQDVCSTYKAGAPLWDTAQALGVSTTVVLNRLKSNGYPSWSSFVEGYQNCKVVSVEPVGEMQLWDLTVDWYKNFCTDSVVSHNTAEISAALDIFADESVAQDANGRTVHVYSDNPAIKSALEELFYNTLNLEFNLRPWCRNLAKYGDFYLYTDVHPEYGVINVVPIPVNELTREEGYDPRDPLAVRFRWMTLGNRTLENWEVAHFRLLGSDQYLPYGTSMIDGARRIWRQLCLKSGTRIWTNTGYKLVEDVRAGDVVFSYDAERNRLVTSNVRAVACMGEQQLVKLRTAHRSIVVTPNHGMLVRQRDGKLLYKRADEIAIDKDELVVPFNEAASGVVPKWTWKDLLDKGTAYSFEIKEAYQPDAQILRNYAQTTGQHAIYEFFKKRRCVSHSTYLALQERFSELTDDKVVVYPRSKDKPCFMQPGKDFEATEDFCRFFGFMHGDGWLTKNQVGFALGVYEEQNTFYRDLAARLFDGVTQTYSPGKPGTTGAMVLLNSKELVDLFKSCGFITGFANKRIPAWVFELPVEHRRAFVRGIHDADGCDVDGRIAFANKGLTEDLRTLCEMSGYRISKEITSQERTDRNKSHRFGINFEDPVEEHVFEKVLHRLDAGRGMTYDLEVDHPLHNFVAEGVVSHNTMIEDAMLVYRITRASDRRVFYIDVGGLPPDEIANYMEAAKENIRGSMVLDRGTGRTDLRYAPMPISHDSCIPLLNNRMLTIAELAKEFEAGKINWVYSVQDKTGKIVPGKVVWCGKNYTATELIRVHLDDGSYVDAAAEHPFILRDGTSKRADELVPGQSLMPLYRRISKPGEIVDGKERLLDGYEMTYEPGTNSWDYTHRHIAESILPHNIIPSTNVVHHVDFNKRNNEPGNLRSMTSKAHCELHRAAARERNKSPAGRAASSSRMRRTWAEGGITREMIAEIRKSPEDRAKRAEALTLQYEPVEIVKFFDQAFDAVFHKNETGVMAEYEFRDALNAIPEFGAYLRAKNSDYKNGYNDGVFNRTTMRNMFIACGFPHGYDSYFKHAFGQRISKELLLAQLGRHKAEVMRRLKLSRRALEIAADIHFGSFAEYSKQCLANGITEKIALGLNHKVVSVERIPGADVYCMTVVGPNGEEDRHNFAVLGKGDAENQSGIFVKNSIEEDFWVATRGTETGTRIDTLQAGNNTANVDDVSYLQRKLIAALKIPAAYLGYNDAIPGCFVGETPIPLMNGKAETMESLAAKCAAGEKLPYVFSYDVKRGVHVPGKIKRAWRTKEVDRLVEVTVRSSFNGSESKFRCTPDHRFLLTDGNYCAAENLEEGSSVESVYGRMSAKKKRGGDELLDGYRMLLQKDGTWEYEHKLVYDAKVAGQYTVGRGRVIHHVDFDKTNNSPENLVEMTWSDHTKLHHADLERTILNPEVIAAREPIRLAALAAPKHREIKRKQATEEWQRHDSLIRAAHESVEFSETMRSASDARWANEGYAQKLSETSKAAWENEAYAATHSGDNHWSKKDYSEYTIEWLKMLCREHGLIAPTQFDAKDRDRTLIPVSRKYVCDLVKRSGYASWNDFRTKELQGIVRNRAIGNHSVVSVEIIELAEPVAVYDLEVETYHNFAVGSHFDAIYAHNSSGLAQVDVRFSRTINMVQRTLVSELNKIAMVHLYTAGFRSDDLLDFEIRLSNPSTIAQQQKLELIRSRLEIAGTAPEGLLSERWIHRNVIGLNDQEILQVKREKLDDARAGEALEAAGALAGGGGGGGGGKEEEAAGEGGGGAPLQTAGDSNEGEGNPVLDSPGLSLPEADNEPGVSPVKLAPGLKKALYNRRRNLRRRSDGFPKVLDRAVSGATAVPAMPESLSLRDLEEDLEPDLPAPDVEPYTTVRPVMGGAELRAIAELSRAKGLPAASGAVAAPPELRVGRERVLSECALLEAPEEHEDPAEFELYADEGDGEPK